MPRVGGRGVWRAWGQGGRGHRARGVHRTPPGHENENEERRSLRFPVSPFNWPSARAGQRPTSLTTKTSLTTARLSRWPSAPPPPAGWRGRRPWAAAAARARERPRPPPRMRPAGGRPRPRPRPPPAPCGRLLPRSPPAGCAARWATARRAQPRPHHPRLPPSRRPLAPAHCPASPSSTSAAGWRCPSARYVERKRVRGREDGRVVMTCVRGRVRAPAPLRFSIGRTPRSTWPHSSPSPSSLGLPLPARHPQRAQTAAPGHLHRPLLHLRPPHAPVGGRPAGGV